MLHDDYVRAHTQDVGERITYLIYSLDLLWSRFFRWTLVSDLDAQIEQRIIQGKTPSGKEISEMYLRLLHQYYGDEADVDSFAEEWMLFPVPFLSYEHQLWVPAIAAACSVMEKLERGDTDARSVTEIYGRGDMDRSYQMLRQLNIKLDTRDPYQSVIRRNESRAR